MKNVAICYRLGTVPTGENTVVVGISSARDDTNVEAIKSAINELNRTEPIWLQKINDSDREGTVRKQNLFIHFLHYYFFLDFSAKLGNV